MRKAALLTVVAGLMVSGIAEARWGRPYHAAGVYIGPLHAGFYAYHLAAVPPPPVFYYAPPVAYYVPAPIYYVPAPAYYVAPPPVVAAYTPPPAPVTPTYYAPAAVPPPPEAVVAPVVVSQEPDRIPRVAVKWAPLGITSLQAPPSTSGSGSTNNFPINAGNVGLEYRFSNGYTALRSDFEYGLYGGAWDFLSLKLSLFKHSWLRPYLSGGVTGTNIYDHNLTTGITTKTPSVGGVAAGGLDLFFGKHFFLEAEVKARVFAIPVGGQTTTPAGATAENFSPTTQFSGMLGAGVAFCWIGNIDRYSPGVPSSRSPPPDSSRIT
jgi:hypothetical protein